MALIIVIISLAAVSIWLIPVKIALMLHIGGEMRFTRSFALFSIRRAEKRASLPLRRKRKRSFFTLITDEKQRHMVYAFLRSLRYLFHHADTEYISAGGSISMQDAADTALLCGGAGALSACLRPFSRISIDFRPDFSSGHSDIRIRGMFSIPAGHIILAAVIGIAHYLKGGFTQWKNTRSKAS